MKEPMTAAFILGTIMRNASRNEKLDYGVRSVAELASDVLLNNEMSIKNNEHYIFTIIGIMRGLLRRCSNHEMGAKDELELIATINAFIEQYVPETKILTAENL